MRVSGKSARHPHPPYIAVTIVVAVLFAAGCGRTPSSQSTRSAVPAVFAGTAHQSASPNTCPQMLSENSQNPFGKPSTGAVTLKAYTLIGCWTGILEGKSFAINQYNSTNAWSGAIVEFDSNTPVAVALQGPPSIIRFTGTVACWTEQAGAYYVAVDIPTGKQLPSQAAQRLCPPQPQESGPAPFGLKKASG